MWCLNFVTCTAKFNWFVEQHWLSPITIPKSYQFLKSTTVNGSKVACRLQYLQAEYLLIYALELISQQFCSIYPMIILSFFEIANCFILHIHVYREIKWIMEKSKRSNAKHASPSFVKKIVLREQLKYFPHALKINYFCICIVSV